MTGEDLHLPPVPVEHLGAFMAGPLPDEMVRKIDQRGLRDVTGPEAVPGQARDLLGGKTGALGGPLDDAGDRVRM